MDTPWLRTSTRLWLLALLPFAAVIVAFLDAWQCEHDCELAPGIVVLSSLGALSLSTVAITIGLTVAAVPPADRKLELAGRLYLLIAVAVLILAPRELLFGKFVLERWAHRLAVIGMVALPVHTMFAMLGDRRTKGPTLRLVGGQILIIVVTVAVAAGLQAFSGGDSVWPRLRGRWLILSLIVLAQWGSVLWALRRVANPRPLQD